MNAAAPFTWNDHAVRRALGLEGAGEAPGRVFTGISTDTRTLERGNLFVALRGPRFDGHDLLGEAVVKGARGAVVSRAALAQDLLPLYPVEDTLVALGHLARYRRRALSGIVVAVTGSSGKTTVKELLRAALAADRRVHATEANLNNRVGVPLTLLEAPDDAEAVVVELGTNEPGEIGILTRITEPDVALVTTVGEAHLTGLTSLEGVLREKLALLEELRPGAPAVVGDEPEDLPRRARELREGVRVAGFSERADADLRGELGAPDTEGRRSFRFRGVEARPRFPGRHGAGNALLALAVAHLLDVPVEAAARAVEAVAPEGLRGERRRVGGLTLLLDCYNANPQSTRAALEHLAELPSGRTKVAVLGSMLELGSRSEPLHEELLAEALGMPLDVVVAVGGFAEAARALEAAGAMGPSARKGAPGPAIRTAPDVDAAWEALRPELQGEEIVLLKGSRGVALERMVPRFEKVFGGRGREEREEG
jgi:UDP-N-acetylmuramoyl-tripeptide--D-alanyl-D-alanine ligase